MNLPLRPVAFAFALAFALGGCGGRSDGGLSTVARAQLAPLVQQVRRAAESGDRQGAQRTLAELQHAVASYQNQGDISPARAAQILTAAAQVESRLALIPTTTTTTTTAPGVGRGHGGKHKGDNANGGND